MNNLIQTSLKIKPNNSFFIQQQQSQIQKHFCYFDIRNQSTLITQSVLLFIAFVVWVIAFKKYVEVWKAFSNRNKNAHLAYLIIMIWWLSYLIKDIYGIIIYIVYNNKQQVTQQLSWFSKLYFSFDWSNAFILQTLLIFVPYHWMKNISQALSAVSGVDFSQYGTQSDLQENSAIGNYKGIQSKIYPKLKNYLLFRILALVPIILFLSLSDYNAMINISKVLLSILLFDCLVIIVILSMGIHSIRTNQLLKMQLDKDQSARLNNQYLIIILCTGVRLLYDTFVAIYGISESLSHEECQLYANSTPLSIIILIATRILAHYLPILVILRIYTVDQKPQQLTKSLVAAY